MINKLSSLAGACRLTRVQACFNRVYLNFADLSSTSWYSSSCIAFCKLTKCKRMHFYGCATTPPHLGLSCRHIRHSFKSSSKCLCKFHRFTGNSKRRDLLQILHLVVFNMHDLYILSKKILSTQGLCLTSLRDTRDYWDVVFRTL